MPPIYELPYFTTMFFLNGHDLGKLLNFIYTIYTKDSFLRDLMESDSPESLKRIGEHFVKY